MSKKKSCKFKVGDPVTSIRYGHGVVIRIDSFTNDTFPMLVEFGEEEEEYSYTLDGKWGDVDFASDLVKGHVKAIKLVGIKDKNVSKSKD